VSRLRNKPRSGRERRAALDLADTVDRIAQHVADASGTVARELTRQGEVILTFSPSGGTTSDGPIYAYMGNRPDLLRVAPADACAMLRGIAAGLRELDVTVSANGLPPPSLPSVNVRDGESRLGERMNVAESVRGLIQWAYDNGVAARGTPALGFAAPFFPDDGESGAEEKKRRAVRRVLYELLTTPDTDLTRAICGLAQVVFEAAGALDALVRRIARINPDVLSEPVEGELQRWVPRADATSPTSATVALVLNKSQGASRYLRCLERTISLCCLFSPYDYEPRGKRPEQARYLDLIKELDVAGFREMEVAALIDDGLGGTMAKRTARVRSNLDRYKLRDSRTKDIAALAV
jgi:hypothetical protein